MASPPSLLAGWAEPPGPTAARRPGARWRTARTERAEGSEGTEGRLLLGTAGRTAKRAVQALSSSQSSELPVGPRRAAGTRCRLQVSMRALRVSTAAVGGRGAARHRDLTSPGRSGPSTRLLPFIIYICNNFHTNYIKIQFARKFRVLNYLRKKFWKVYRKLPDS